MTKILTVVGARPQFIKAAVVSRAIKKRKGISELLVHTGQHFDTNMSQVFFEEMKIPKPVHNLHVNSMPHGKMTGRMLEGLEGLMLEEKPDAVLVYGDTNSTLAGALAAVKLHIPVAHVEAGLRSFNMEMPEEINRILTDRVSKWLLCPTQTALDNLKAEGYSNMEVQIEQVGDVMYDAASYYQKMLAERFSALPALPEQPFILATLHRQENTSKPARLKELINTLNFLHRHRMPLVVPMHPSTRKKIETSGLVTEFDIIDPVGYFDMIRLLRACTLVMTDSGGLQKEAFFFEKFCITMRDQTEWVELVDHGVNWVVGANKEKILDALDHLSKLSFPTGLSLYGDGNAGDRIVDVLMR